jgi:hypothetical protein
MNGRVKHAQERMAVLDEEDDDVELSFLVFLFFCDNFWSNTVFQYKRI